MFKRSGGFITMQVTRVWITWLIKSSRYVFTISCLLLVCYMCSWSVTLMCPQKHWCWSLLENRTCFCGYEGTFHEAPASETCCTVQLQRPAAHHHTVAASPPSPSDAGWRPVLVLVLSSPHQRRTLRILPPGLKPNIDQSEASYSHISQTPEAEFTDLPFSCSDVRRSHCRLWISHVTMFFCF